MILPLGTFRVPFRCAFLMACCVSALFGEGQGRWELAGPFFDGTFPRRTPGTGGGTGAWVVEPVFPELSFEDTTVLVPAPGSDRLYVGSQQGHVVWFDPRESAPVKHTFLDLRSRVEVVRHGGLLGMAFHPEYNEPHSPNRGLLYVYYTAPGPFLRLSRFKAQDSGAQVDLATELIMINVRLVGRSHRGGGMTFGNDGFLYLSIGDQYRYETAQDIVDTLEGGILRIDVDRDPERSHPPRRRFPLADPGEISGIGYGIPHDNPFLDLAGGIFEEYFTLGNRNTHRLTNDRVTGTLWSGDVGQWQREEINLIEKGGNYGWPFREGTLAGEHDPPAEIRGELKDPLIDFSRSEASSIIGGYVYRGSDYPDLWAKFICGDYMTNRVWAITKDDAGGAHMEWLARFDPGGLSTFGIDSQGEIYLCGLGQKPLYKLVRAEPVIPDPPSHLSELGVFKDLETLETHACWMPYSLNVSSWSDGAVKFRWLTLPAGGKIRFSADSAWEFPVGTVFMKHFEMPLDERRPEVRRRLETRFLVHGEDERYYGVTYRWRPDGSDADLVLHSDRESMVVQTDEGKLALEWYYPSRNDCAICHNANAGFVLGMRTHQLNRMPSISGPEDLRLETLNQMGLFESILPSDVLQEASSAVPLGDERFPIALRVHSYLDANCAYCHHSGGSAATGLDLRLLTPLEKTGLIEGEVADGLGLMNPRVIAPGNVRQSVLYRRMAGLGAESMPPVPHGRLDRGALRFIAQWIKSLDDGGASPSHEESIKNLCLESLPSGHWLTFRRSSGGVLLKAIRWETSEDLLHWNPLAVDPEQTFITPLADGREELVRIAAGGKSAVSGMAFFRFLEP